MNKFTKFIGMDVHKATIAVSVADAGSSEVRYFGEIANTAEAIVKLVKQLRKGDGQLSFCYQHVVQKQEFFIEALDRSIHIRSLRGRRFYFDIYHPKSEFNCCGTKNFISKSMHTVTPSFQCVLGRNQAAYLI